MQMNAATLPARFFICCGMPKGSKEFWPEDESITGMPYVPLEVSAGFDGSEAFTHENSYKQGVCTLQKVPTCKPKNG